ncbi:hypothetical protein F0562_030750 [Nyssa sinensis]|uniref:Pentatricopeptide repeat-containing protein n=1 Tax=Nyssa sinensis TaxID=561372 RepID=A0A5J5AZP7_9ASTE|nr:hypothetical protein F0562_030750 [Nyssa sinensis]
MSGTTEDVPVVVAAVAAEAPRGREQGHGGKKTREQSRVREEQAMLEGRVSMMEDAVGEIGERLDRHEHNFEALEGYMMGEMEQKECVIGTLIHGLCELGNVDGALKIYTEMIKGGVSPDVVTHNALLNGYCRAGKIKKSFKLWDLMGKEDCRRVVSYNIFMRGLFENAKVDEAILIWKLLPEKGCVGDSITYSVLIHGLCKNGYSNRALWVLNEAKDRGDRLDISAYSSMINGLCREGRLDEGVTM